MPSRLTEAHIRGEAKIREGSERAVRAAWRSLPAYDRGNIPEFLEKALPVVRAAVLASANLTAAYIARSLERQPSGFDADAVLRGLRNGVPLEEVYSRPFVDVWTALEAGTLWVDAVKQGEERAAVSAATDPQLAMRDTASQIDAPYGYRRTVNPGACEFCQVVNGAYVKSGSAMPLHPYCGCSLEVLTEPHERAVKLPDGTRIRDFQHGPLNVTVHQHGELGAVLGDPAHNFTSESDIA